MNPYRQSRPFFQFNSITEFDFSTIYTTIPFPKIKPRFKEFAQLLKNTVSNNKFSDNDIIKMQVFV